MGRKHQGRKASEMTHVHHGICAVQWKIRYTGKRSARTAARLMTEKYGVPMFVYQCLACASWHITKQGQGHPGAGRERHGWGSSEADRGDRRGVKRLSWR